ncbi:hypothetical protein KR222_003370, partial [Zaprionus bogoriensis]
MCNASSKHNSNSSNNNNNSTNSRTTFKFNSNSDSSSNGSGHRQRSATAEIIDQRQQHQRKLYEIIDNLSQLSVCDSRSSDRRSIHLSQLSVCDSRSNSITFADYTQQVALYGAKFE